MRTTKTFELPVSKIKVEMATYWTLDEYFQIENKQYKAAKSVRMVKNNDTGKEEAVTDINGEAMLDTRKSVIILAIKKLTAADGTDIPVVYESIADLSMVDGRAIEDEIEGMEGATKKK